MNNTGDDFDREIMQWIISEFKKEQGVDLGNDKMALQRLKGHFHGKCPFSFLRREISDQTSFSRVKTIILSTWIIPETLIQS